MQILFLKRTLALLVVLTFSFSIISNAQPVPLKWGKVPSEDLNMTTYEADPDADAVALGTFEEVTVNLRGDYAVSYDVHVRIKILTQEGVDIAETKIPYFNKERITGFQAQTINQGEIIKVKGREVFNEEVTENYNRKRFTFPDIQIGSVIEYRYTLQSPYYVVLRDWYFQREDMPVRWSECRFSMPSYLEYVMVTDVDRSFDIKENKKITMGNGSGVRHRFVMENMAAREEEKYITTMDDYLNKIEFQLVSLTQPSGIMDKYMKDWPDLIKTWWEREDGGKQIKNKINHKKILNDAQLRTAGISDTKEKAEALFDFIKDSYTWNNRFGDYTNEKRLNIAYEKKTGNSAEINMSLIACLRDADIEAHPIRITTRSNGKLKKIYPIVAQFNHIAVLVKIGDKEYLMDAIDEDLIFGMLHPASLNYEGLLLERTKGKPTWINLTAPKTTEIVNINLKIEDEESTAELTGVYTGYSAWSKRYEHRKQDEEDYIEERLGDMYDFEVESVEFNTEKPTRFAEVIELKVADAVTSSAENIYINPFLMEQTDERVFSLEKREYPVDISVPYIEKYILNLAIPEGYEVSEQPEDIKMTLPDGSGTYLYMIQISNNTLQLRCEESLKKPVYMPSEYEALKAFFDLIFDKEAEQIILTKK